ncbi:MAG TPA: HIT family protein [Candidatus Nanoarchaeia archaeon]|nr:HIT family protein [Candidatus Nanoarchaeia archaeon]
MENCQLCEIPEKESYRLIKENNHAMACIILEPITESHLLILPKRHVVNLKELQDQEAKEFLTLVYEMSEILQQKFNTKGAITSMNHGSSASQSHIHFHTIATDLSMRDAFAEKLNGPSRKRLAEEELTKLANNIKAIITER